MKRVTSTMSTDKDTLPSRRQVLQATGGLAAAAMVTGFRFPDVHPGGSDMIQVALVGCGGRGGGAAENAVSTTSGPIKLVAMADVFADRLNQTRDNLKKDLADKMDVPAERQFDRVRRLQARRWIIKPGDKVISNHPTPLFR